jgi:hypothetical protein
VVLMLFSCPAMLWLAAACRQSRGGGDAAGHPDCRRARRFLAAPDAAGGDGAQHRLHHAVDDAAGQRRSAYGADPDVDFRLDLQRDAGEVVRSGIAMVLLLALVPLCRRWLTILPLGGEAARGGHGADAVAGRSAAAGGLPDGGGHADHWPAEFCRPDGAAYRANDGLPPDDAAYGDVRADGGLLLVFADWCGRMMMFPYQIPAGLLSTFIGAPYFIYLLRKQSR